jgi:hypothetical protein
MTDPLTETRDDGITPSLRSKAGEPRNGHTPSHSRLMRAHFADPEGGSDRFPPARRPKTVALTVAQCHWRDRPSGRAA